MRQHIVMIWELMVVSELQYNIPEGRGTKLCGIPLTQSVVTGTPAVPVMRHFEQLWVAIPSENSLKKCGDKFKNIKRFSKLLQIIQYQPVLILK